MFGLLGNIGAVLGMESLPLINLAPATPRKLSVGDKAWRAFYKGKHYPHSSTRQRARYARQIAAGQLNIGRVVAPEPVAVVEPVKAKKPRARKTIGAVVE
jgi:hypothetical protein